MTGKMIKRQLINEACRKQRLVEHAAALDEQVRSIAGLEARDSLGGIADEALAVVPRQRPVGRCHDMLSNGIERLADRLVAVVAAAHSCRPAAAPSARPAR